MSSYELDFNPKWSVFVHVVSDIQTYFHNPFVWVEHSNVQTHHAVKFGEGRGIC